MALVFGSGSSSFFESAFLLDLDGLTSGVVSTTVEASVEAACVTYSFKSVGAVFLSSACLTAPCRIIMDI